MTNTKNLPTGRDLFRLQGRDCHGDGGRRGCSVRATRLLVIVDDQEISTLKAFCTRHADLARQGGVNFTVTGVNRWSGDVPATPVQRSILAAALPGSAVARELPDYLLVTLRDEVGPGATCSLSREEAFALILRVSECEFVNP